MYLIPDMGKILSSNRKLLLRILIILFAFNNSIYFKARWRKNNLKPLPNQVLPIARNTLQPCFQFCSQENTGISIVKTISDIQLMTPQFHTTPAYIYRIFSISEGKPCNMSKPLKTNGKNEFLIHFIIFGQIP